MIKDDTLPPLHAAVFAEVLQQSYASGTFSRNSTEIRFYKKCRIIFGVSLVCSFGVFVSRNKAIMNFNILQQQVNILIKIP